jgi:transposase
VTDTPRTQANDLRDQGVPVSVIAERLGVAVPTIYRWTDRDYAERTRETSRRWKAQNPERRRALDQAAHLRRFPFTCPTCGGGSATEGDCGHCEARAGRDTRYRFIAERWAAGDSMRQIAALLNSTPKAIGADLHRMREDGWELPYRRQPTREALAA